ncbi:MAG: insulinase family protein [Flavobacteriales bacterium]|nr:insulinase family protein [Flavobacteriales bacterium]
MIDFEKFELENGLRVIVHHDDSTELVALNLLYDVGARDEDESKTGFAHLFEHLMFGGSVNIPDYDKPLEMACGDNNAFTTNDITNYYLTIPLSNIETGFWLESDRMLSLAFSEKSLEVQRQVVIEEYKQRYLNQPYGDDWLLLRPMAYKVHPYKWPTIGEDIKHIEEATMEDVKAFFNKHYCPNNAILCVAGNVSVEQVQALSEKWFGPIPKGSIEARNIPMEPKQTESRLLKVEREVPADAIYKVYHMCKRTDSEFYTADLMSDILSGGRSSRLYVELLKKKKMFSEIDAYISADSDNGLFVFSGKLHKGVGMEDADRAIEEEIDKIKSTLVSETELYRVKNKTESMLVFQEINLLNKAMNLCAHELMWGADKINDEAGKYLAVTPESIKIEANKIFAKDNCSTLHYYSK